MCSYHINTGVIIVRYKPEDEVCEYSEKILN